MKNSTTGTSLLFGVITLILILLSIIFLTESGAVQRRSFPSDQVLSIQQSTPMCPISIDVLRLRTWIYNLKNFRILSFSQMQPVLTRKEEQRITSLLKLKNQVKFTPLWLLYKSLCVRDTDPPYAS